MKSSLTNARAAMIVIQADRHAEFRDNWLSMAEREQIAKETDDFEDFCKQQIAALDAKEQRIAMLEGHILLAFDGLSAWLTDNTDEVFEEQPEIDGIRDDLWAAVHD